MVMHVYEPNPGREQRLRNVLRAIFVVFLSLFMQWDGARQHRWTATFRCLRERHLRLS
jgi:hypothetical protein